MNEENLVNMLKVACNDNYIREVLKVLDKTKLPSEQMECIATFGSTLENTVTERFDPWVYIAGYIETKDQFWDNISNTLNEEFVTYVYITYGWEQGLLRNRLQLVDKQQSMKYFRPQIALFIEGKVHESFFEQFIMCKTHKTYVLDAMEQSRIMKLYTNIKDNKVFDQLKNTLYKDIEICYVETKEELYEYETLVCLSVNTTFKSNINEYVNSQNDVFCSGFFVKKKDSNSILYLSTHTSKRHYTLN